MRVVLLVPRRDDGGHRDALWAWCRARWEALCPDFAIYEGHHTEGPFNRSAAINLAADLADRDGRWDVAVVIDSDVFLRASAVRRAVKQATQSGAVVWAHRRWRGLHEDATARVIADRTDFGPELADHDMDLLIERTNPMSWSCCIAIPRKVWDELGGFDERFRGWGFEDMAFMSAVRGLFTWDRIDASDVFHLWHPRSQERIVHGRPAGTASPEHVTNARLGRRYMVAVIRDYGIGDQPGEEHLSDELRDIHISNLKADDKKLSLVAYRHRLPDWDTWWPTLDELVDGAKQARSEKQSHNVTATSITVVLRTGGVLENWPERRGYLLQSLQSFAKQVSGPIVQRVIYSDWDTSVTPELTEIGAAHGFYVVGGGHFGYTAGTARMWKYLAKRAVGDLICQVEDDFLYRHPVDLMQLAAVLKAHPELAQVALLRAPAYESERRHGGILGWPEESFEKVRINGFGWLEHRNFWTMNPSLFRRELTEQAWPQRESSEKFFGDQLMRNSKLRFAFWGDGSPTIDHIGTVRAGVGY